MRPFPANSSKAKCASNLLHSRFTGQYRMSPFPSNDIKYGQYERIRGGGGALARPRWCRRPPPRLLPPYLYRVPYVTMWRLRLTHRLPLTQWWPGKPPQEWSRPVTPVWGGGIPPHLPLRQASVTHTHPPLGRSMPWMGYSAT